MFRKTGRAEGRCPSVLPFADGKYVQSFSDGARAGKARCTKRPSAPAGRAEHVLRKRDAYRPDFRRQPENAESLIGGGPGEAAIRRGFF